MSVSRSTATGPISTPEPIDAPAAAATPQTIDEAKDTLLHMVDVAGSDSDACLLLVDEVNVGRDRGGDFLEVVARDPGSGPDFGVPPLQDLLAWSTGSGEALDGIRLKLSQGGREPITIENGRAAGAPRPAGPAAAADPSLEGIGARPTVQEFARSWATAFTAAIRRAAGDDQTLSLAEAKALADERGASALFSDNAVSYLTRTGTDEVDVDKLSAAGHRYATAVGLKAAGEDGRISTAESFELPQDLFADFHLLRSLGIDATDAPTAAQPTPQALADDLAAILDDVWFSTEGDEPYDPIVIPLDPGAPITPETLGPLLTFPADEHIEVSDLNDVLDDLTRVDDPDGEAERLKWVDVANTMRAHLEDLRYVTIRTDSGDGTTPHNTMLVGRLPGGPLVGIATTAVYT